MFIGAYARTLDRDGRIVLPPDFLGEIQKEPVVLLDCAPTPSLALIPLRVLKKITVRLGPGDIPPNERLERSVFKSAFQMVADTKGRINIPAQLRKYANLTGDVLLLGLVDRIELWNPTQFDSWIPEDRSLETFGQEARQSPFYGNKRNVKRSLNANGHLSLVRLAYKIRHSSYRAHTQKGARHLFICHSSSDKPFARRLARDLIRRGITVWLDEWEMLPGDSLYEKIQKGIKTASWFAIVLSPDSVDSQWCKRELHNALEEEFERENIFVIPILYRACEIPGFLREKVFVNLSEGSYRKELPKLLRRLDT